MWPAARTRDGISELALISRSSLFLDLVFPRPSGPDTDPDVIRPASATTGRALPDADLAQGQARRAAAADTAATVGRLRDRHASVSAARTAGDTASAGITSAVTPPPAGWRPGPGTADGIDISWGKVEKAVLPA
jgi:hypothetical protein